jgi:hypothetical protein
MKKIIGLIIIAVATGLYAQQIEEPYVIKEWIGTLGTTAVTQYIGEARTTEYTTNVPSTNSPLWKITKYTYATNGLPLTTSVARTSDGKVGYSIWTNRVNATYNHK